GLRDELRDALAAKDGLLDRPELGEPLEQGRDAVLGGLRGGIEADRVEEHRARRLDLLLRGARLLEALRSLGVDRREPRGRRRDERLRALAPLALGLGLALPRELL